MFSADKLKKYRLSQNLSQTAIANKLGVTRATLYLGKQKKCPNFKELAKTPQINYCDFQYEHPHITLYKQLNKIN